MKKFRPGDLLSPKDAALNRIIQHCAQIMSMATGGWDEEKPADIELRLHTMTDMADDLVEQITVTRAQLNLNTRLKR